MYNIDRHAEAICRETEDGEVLQMWTQAEPLPMGFGLLADMLAQVVSPVALAPAALLAAIGWRKATANVPR